MTKSPAKLTPPRLHSVLLRDRLFARIEDLRRYPVIWVAGPPGSGKTSLIASYLDVNRIPSLWLQIDSTDGDISTFFHYLTMAARKLRRKPELPLLTPEYLLDLAGYTRHYFRKLYEYMTPGSFLVLDDHHEIPADSRLREVIDCALGEVPPDINVCVLSRSDPPPTLARLIALERLECIGWGELKLTLQEARSLVSMRAEVGEQVVRRLHEQAGGWVAGLTLIVERLRHVGGEGAEARNLPLASVFNYFASQIFAVVPAETQDFLVKTSLLPRMSPAMAESMTGLPKAPHILESLFRRGLFTERRDSVYQYHDLFRAFLREELARIYTASGQDDLRRRAGDLLEAAGYTEDAVSLYIEAADWPSIVRIVRTHAVAYFQQGRGDGLGAWIDAVPDAFLADQPWMLYWKGITRLQAAPATAREFLERAYRLFVEGGVRKGQTLACAGSVSAFWFEFANLRPMDAWIDRLRLLTDPGPEFRTPETELQIATALVFGVAFRRPQPDAWRAVSARIESLLARDLSADVRVSAATMLLLCYRSVGEMDRGKRLILALEPLAARSDVSPMHRSQWWLQVGWHNWFCGAAEAAREAFELTLRIGELHELNLAALKVYPLLGLSYCAIDRGDLDAADEYCRRAEARWDSGRVLDIAFTARTRCLIETHRGHWTGALQFAERSVACAADASIWWEFNNRLLQGFLLVRIGDTQEGAAQLKRARSLVEGTAHDACTCEVDLVEAYMFLQGGRSRACRTALRSALQKMALQGFHYNTRTFPGLYPRLLAEALSADIEGDYASRLIRHLSIPAPAEAPEQWPWPLRVHTLGRLRILRDGKPVVSTGKLPKKPLQLLKAIVAYGGREVPERYLADALWPDEDGDLAHNSFNVALARLRKLLGVADVIIQSGSCLTVDTRRVWIDAFAFERRIAAGSESDSPAATRSLEYGLRLYQERFLVDEGDVAWTVPMRERLQNKFVRGLSVLGRRQMAAGNIDAAIATYHRGIDTDPLVEEFYRELIGGYACRGLMAEALSVYQRLARTLNAVLGTTPSPATEALVASLRSRHPLPRQHMAG